MDYMTILKNYINGKDTMKETLVQAIENLIKENNELKDENKKYVDILHDLKASWGNRKKYKNTGNHIPRID